MELSTIILALAFSSAVGLNLDKKALAELSEEDQALVENEVNNFLNTAGQKLVNAIKEHKNADVSRHYQNIQAINTGPAYAALPCYHGQKQWPIKNAPQCALITWIKWVLQTIKFVYEQGMEILRINNALNL